MNALNKREIKIYDTWNLLKLDFDDTVENFIIAYDEYHRPWTFTDRKDQIKFLNVCLDKFMEDSNEKECLLVMELQNMIFKRMEEESNNDV